MSPEGGPAPDMQHMLTANPNVDAQLRDMATSTAVMERPVDDLVVRNEAPAPAVLQPEEVAGTLLDIRDLHSTDPTVRAQALEKHGFNPNEHDETQFVGQKYEELTQKVVGHAEANQAQATGGSSLNEENPLIKLGGDKREQLLAAAQNEIAAERAEQGIIEPTVAADEDEFAHMRPGADAPHDPDLADVQKNGMTYGQGEDTTGEDELAKNQVSDFLTASDEAHQESKQLAQDQADTFLSNVQEMRDKARQDVDDFLVTPKTPQQQAQAFMENAGSIDNADFEADDATKNRVADFLEASSPQQSQGGDELPVVDGEDIAAHGSEEDEDDLELAEFLTIPQEVDPDVSDLIDDATDEPTRREKVWNRFIKVCVGVKVGGQILAQEASRYFGDAEKGRRRKVAAAASGVLAVGITVGGAVLAYNASKHIGVHEGLPFTGGGRRTPGEGAGRTAEKVRNNVENLKEFFSSKENSKAFKDYLQMTDNFKAANPVLEGGVTFQGNPERYNQLMNEMMNNYFAQSEVANTTSIGGTVASAI